VDADEGGQGDQMNFGFYY